MISPCFQRHRGDREAGPVGLDLRGQPQERHAADEPGGDHRPGPEQVVLDRLLGHDAHHDRGQERHDEGDQQAAAVGVLPDQALQDRHDPLPVEDEHGEDGAELDGDGVGVGGVLGGVGVADAEDALGDEQVPGRADRQVLGDALDHAEHDRLPRRHLRIRRGDVDARRRVGGDGCGGQGAADRAARLGGGRGMAAERGDPPRREEGDEHDGGGEAHVAAAGSGSGGVGGWQRGGPARRRRYRRGLTTWGRRRRCPAPARSWRRRCAGSSAGWSSAWPGG